MKPTYIKFDKAVEMLNDDWEIFTDRGCGGAPYTPLFFKLYKGKDCGGEIHHQTIAKLIKDGVINGTNVDHGKYKLKQVTENL